MNSLLKKIFGTKNDREIKRLKKIVGKINNLEIEMEKLTDEQLREKTIIFRERLSKGEDLNNLMIEAFATVREAAKRVLEMRHYDVQLIGGIVLFEGKITEMKTGEGKTLVATCPIYLNALSGKGVHVVTVNDYLTARDREIMKPLFDFLGISTGVILAESTPEERKEAYLCDVTYGTTSQFGFDYLRDNMVYDFKDKVQREFNTCIIDEVDSVLIDESRTPLIISGEGTETDFVYEKFQKIADILDRSFETEKLQKITDLRERKEKLENIPKEEKRDYEVDEKEKNIVLTDKGVKKVEKLLGVENLYSVENIELTHYLKQALNAKELYKKDKDYLIKNNEIIIIDVFTGRAMEGRRFSDGLHQALEAKEGLKVVGESETIASITIQNYFRMYKKLAGMTGTGETEAVEFEYTYGLKVVVIPTNKPIQRKDYADKVYRTHQEKIEAVIKKIKEVNKKGQPILIGTASIKSSEELSNLLEKEGIKHNVLNAKYHAQEAEIIAQAGRYGAVTIATNMAGRGTDILLGGNPEGLALKACGNKENENYIEILKKFERECNNEKARVKSIGGLFILGTEKHESRRIDNQLRGRAGRQGDVGESQFFLSFDDELMRLFGSNNIKFLLDKLGLKYGEAIDDSSITKIIEKAQSNIEMRNFSIRKSLLEYDEIVNRQREAIYATRNNILVKNEKELRESIYKMAKEILSLKIKTCFKGENKEDWEITELADYLAKKYDYILEDLEEYKRNSIEDYIELLFNKIKIKYEEKLEKYGIEEITKVEKFLLLNFLDIYWREHIKNLEALKAGIHLRTYGQKNPVIEYKILAGEMYEEMLINFKEDLVSHLMFVRIEKKIDNTDGIIENEIDLDEACPCNSGKIRRNCCSREVKTITEEGFSNFLMKVS